MGRGDECGGLARDALVFTRRCGAGAIRGSLRRRLGRFAYVRECLRRSRAIVMTYDARREFTRAPGAGEGAGGRRPPCLVRSVSEYPPVMLDDRGARCIQAGRWRRHSTARNVKGQSGFSGRRRRVCDDCVADPASTVEGKCGGRARGGCRLRLGVRRS